MHPTRTNAFDRNDLPRFLGEGVRVPLSALRASLETLAHRFEERDPREQLVGSALALVVRLQHDLQTILDAETPPTLRPLPCTLQELAASAVRALSSAHRERAIVAVEGGRARFQIDGPLFSRALSRLLECALDRGSEPALLRARDDGREAAFTLLLRGPAPVPGSIDELALAVAARDVERMGGSFRHGADAIEIRFALARAGEEAA
jgi:hypothetical protein